MQAATDPTGRLVVLVTRGIDSEMSSVAFVIANGSITAGLKVSMLLTSTAIDLVRKGGQKLTQVAPLDSLAKLIEDFQSRGGTIWACPPCVKSRGYEQADLIEGVSIVGASVIFAEMKQRPRRCRFERSFPRGAHNQACRARTLPVPHI
jgi:predicted peroxiredoxin